MSTYNVSSGQTSTGIVLNYADYMYVAFSGTANSTTVNSPGSMHVLNGGTANSTTVNSGGSLTVWYGGTANNIVENGGYVSVAEGANVTFTPNTFSGLVLSTWASATLHSGTTANSTTVGWGDLYVYGGTANRTTVNSGGSLTVWYGGTANSTTVNSGGSMYVSSGGTANITTVNSSGRLYVSSGGTANSTTVNSGGSMYVSSGGTANSTTVNSGSLLNVSSGVTANRTTVNSSGGLVVSSGGTANSTTVNSDGCLTVWYGGTANNIVENGGYVSVAEGANVTFTPNTFSGLVLSTWGASATLHSGTTANSTTINGGSLYVSGGMVDSTTVNSGYLYVRSGTANSTTVNSSGCLSVWSGTANSTTVNSTGRLYVSDGGTANRTMVNSGGSLTVWYSTANSTTVNSGGSLTVRYGTANNTIVNSSGLMHVSGGMVDNTTVNGGDLCVYSGGKANSATVNFNGGLVVWSGGTASSATVNSGGYLCVYSDGKVTGMLTMGSGAVVSAFAGSLIDFDISGLTAWAPARVNNLSLIQGTPDYSITVSSNQASGTYKLAEGAAGFNKTVTIRTTGNVSSTITVGNTVELSGQYYTLDLTNSLLSLTVSGQAPGPAPAPEGTKVNLQKNGVSQILAWDGTQGKVGFMGTNGNPSPGWRGVWEWSTAYNPALGASEADLWKVVAAGRFSGSTVDHDGILLYNGIGNTFAAWTNLNDPSYGYVSLCHVDGNFQTKCLGDFDNNGFDDVIIFNEKGSVGIVSDAASYHDVWHVDNAASNPWQLLGAGTFDGAIGQDSLLFRNTANGHLYLWDNQGSDLASWNWRQKDIGYLASGWEFAAIGDFKGDGIDDIALVNHNDNDAVFVWDDGIQSTQHYAGVPGAGFKVETVGDYDGDGKDDLLLREYNTGWGGIGCWLSADANNWFDFNDRIETNLISSFTIVA